MDGGQLIWCNHVIMMNTKLQVAFSSALAAAGKTAKSVRQMPIYRRPERTELRAIKEAATALTALWKMNAPGLKS
jgi:hypothetical protein